METTLPAPYLIPLLGFILGIFFGAVSVRSNFCTMGAVSDIVVMGDWNRMRMWMLAIAVALAGTTALQLKGWLDITDTIYTAPRLVWLSHIVGGLLFGVGMVLASGCAGKNLVRIGGGSLRAAMVFMVIAISAYMTLKGLYALLRVNLLDPVSVTLSTPQDLPTVLAQATGAARNTWLIALTALIAGGFAIFSLAGKRFRTFDRLLGGIGIGLAVAAAWYVSGHLGHVAEHPDTLQEAYLATNSGRAESFSFVALYAYTMELLMMWTDTSRVVTYGIAMALGVVAGSFLYSVLTGNFRLETFTDTGDLMRHVIGGNLMGFGAVVSMGCTIGQGVTGFSTLAIGSILTTFSIIAGAVPTLRWILNRA